METILTKKCKKCGLNKPLEEFCICRINKDGLNTVCRDCERLYKKFKKTEEFKELQKEKKNLKNQLLRRCSICTLIKPYSEFNKDKTRKEGIRFTCKDCDQEYDKKYETNPQKLEKKRESSKRWREKPENQFLIKEHRKNPKNILTIKDWQKNNPDKVNAQIANRRARKSKRSPPWLTDEDHLQIRAFYREARRLTLEIGILHEVDHIIPLQGKYMSGLHVPWNLRVVTREFNRSRKKNIKPFQGYEPQE